MTETLLAEAGGTDDLGQLVWILIHSVWLIILKNLATLWQIAAVLGLIAGYKYVKRGVRPKPAAPKPFRGSRRHEDDEGSEEEGEPERRPSSSRGRSPHRERH
jgi:hypothetical protein